jgi:hypothetical protein
VTGVLPDACRSTRSSLKHPGFISIGTVAPGVAQKPARSHRSTIPEKPPDFSTRDFARSSNPHHPHDNRPTAGESDTRLALQIPYVRPCAESSAAVRHCRQPRAPSHAVLLEPQGPFGGYHRAASRLTDGSSRPSHPFLASRSPRRLLRVGHLAPSPASLGPVPILGSLLRSANNSPVPVNCRFTGSTSR